MDTKFINATTQRPEGNRTTDAQLVTIDLASFIEQIKEEKEWKESDRNAITVFKTNGMCIVLVALHKDAEMIKHTAAGLISVEVLEGKMIFKTENNSINLGKGKMLALHEGIQHSVLAQEETIFLLTITNVLTSYM